MSLGTPSTVAWNRRVRQVDSVGPAVVPGNARASRFIAKMNINAVQYSDGTDGAPVLTETDQWAFPGKGHPEDKGVVLTRQIRFGESGNKHRCIAVFCLNLAKYLEGGSSCRAY